MQYLHRGLWVFAEDTTFEDKAVQISRALWKKSDVTGVKILKTTTEVFKEAVRPGAQIAPGGGGG